MMGAQCKRYVSRISFTFRYYEDLCSKSANFWVKFFKNLSCGNYNSGWEGASSNISARLAKLFYIQINLSWGRGEWGLSDINFGCSFTFSFTSHAQRHVAALKLSIRSRSRQHFPYYQFALSGMVGLCATFTCFAVTGAQQAFAILLLQKHGIFFHFQPF